MINASMTYERLFSLSSVVVEKTRRILRVIWKALSFSVADDLIAPKHSLCIVIEKGCVSIAKGSRIFSKYRIKGFKEHFFEDSQYPQPERVASLTKSSLNDIKAGNAEVILCIPREWTIFQVADFPLTVRENLSDVVSYELDRLTPLNPENAYYDYRVIGEQDERLNIVLMVANADFINKYLRELKESGINVGVVTTEMSAANALIGHIETVPQSPSYHSAEPKLQVKVWGKQGTRQSLFTDGLKKLLRLSHSLAMTLRHFFSGKKADFIFLNVSESAYEGFLREGGVIVSMFTGAMETPDNKAMGDAVIAEINKLITALRIRGKGIQCVASFKDIAHLNLEQSISLPVRVLRHTDLKINFAKKTEDIPCTAVGGVVESLSAKARGVNLLSRGKYEREKTPLLVTALLVLALFIIGIVHLIMPLQMDEKRLHEIERQITGLKEEVNKAEALKKERDRLADEISTINDFKEESPMTLAVVKELTTILPRTSWLTRIRITDKTVDMEGYATTSPADLLSKLEASKYLQKVEFASPTVKDTRMNSDRFVFKMEIEDAEETEEPKQKADETTKK